MNRRFSSHFFWGSHSPFAALSATALIILSSGRLAYAIICASAVIWVYVLTALVYSASLPIMPLRGRVIILLFLLSFFCGIFFMIIGMINPLLILGSSFFLVLIPVWCISSNFFEASESFELMDIVTRALLESASLGGIIIAFSLIREPIGIGTLSFPGGVQGIIEIFGNFETNPNTFFPARIVSVTSGGLLLFGYATALFRYFKEQNGFSIGDSR